MFRSINGSGFHIQFANGYCVSVQFGAMNYCDNRSLNNTARPTENVECRDAEVAVWNDKDEWTCDWPHNNGYDDVQGHLTPDQVLQIMNWAQAQPKSEEE